MPALKVGIDPPPIRSSDAARLMAHHLSLATAYFEATGNSQLKPLAEIADVFENNEAGLTGARVWYKALVDGYAALDQG